MAIRPMIDDIELQQVQIIESDQQQALARHRVPGLEGDLFQRMGRCAGSIWLRAVLTGAGSLSGVETLAEKFRAGAPVAFVADIADAVRVDQVLIDRFTVRDLAGRPQRYEVTFLLREFQPVQPPSTSEETFAGAGAESVEEDAEAAGAGRAEEVTGQVAAGQGDLLVDVAVESGGDASGLAVLVDGTSDEGEAVHFTIDEQSEGRFVRRNLPAGNYTVQVFRR
jgi:hypothetical protein